MPDFLRVRSPEIKWILNELEKNESTKRPAGVKRAATVLETDGSFVYVDYTEPDRLNGQYALKKLKNI